jgi:hypothetical protein
MVPYGIFRIIWGTTATMRAQAKKMDRPTLSLDHLEELQRVYSQLRRRRAAKSAVQGGRRTTKRKVPNGKARFGKPRSKTGGGGG